MKILKLDKSLAATANGLTQQTGGFGNRVDDSRISLGCGDAFKIKAIYDLQMPMILFSTILIY